MTHEMMKKIVEDTIANTEVGQYSGDPQAEENQADVKQMQVARDAGELVDLDVNDYTIGDTNSEFTVSVHVEAINERIKDIEDDIEEDGVQFGLLRSNVRNTIENTYEAVEASVRAQDGLNKSVDDLVDNLITMEACERILKKHDNSTIFVLKDTDGGHLICMCPSGWISE